MTLAQIRIFIVTIFTSFSLLTVSAQQMSKKYTAEWKKVTDFVSKNLPKSALAEVKKIYALAKKENQDAQVIKALVFMSNVQQDIRENNEILSIQEIEKEISTSREPAASILRSLLAEKYWNYFSNNRWQLYDRTRTVDYKKDDIATWDIETFHQKITTLHLQAIKEERILQQTKLPAFDAIIVKGNVHHLRPTLYDLLVHRAIGYFDNDERDIKRPAYAFEIDQASAFDPAADFSTHKFTTRDSMSLHHKALQLYQKLIVFHLRDPKPDALIDADLLRIEFVKRRSTHPEKDKLYFNAINHIARQYENLPAASQAWYLLANYYEEQAKTYKPDSDTTHRYARIKAKEILEKVLAQKDSSEGKINAYNLLQEVNSRTLQFNLEKVNTPNQPFRALVNYRNFTTLYLRLIKPGEALKNNLENSYDEKYWPSILDARVEKSWQQTLPVTNDMQQHGVEIKIDGLPAGEYLLVAGTDKDFKDKKTLLGARFFYVSSISFVNSGNDYFLLNRESGQPLAKAAVQVWDRAYDSKNSKYIKSKGKTYQADANGFFHLVFKRNESNRWESFPYYLDITYNNERLFMNELQHDYYYYYDNSSAEPKTSNSIFLFADRSLYRPGQQVFFKGIVVSKNEQEKKAVPQEGYETTVYLFDANSQDIDSIQVKTNEYGSFSGKFQLPQTGLNGNFRIYTKKDNSSVEFNVEEYKRPKFFVEYEPIKGTYKVNDKITITGIAKAYAGNNIDGATVSYRVVRNPRFLYPWMFYRSWRPRTMPMEIAHGEVKTDKDGRFTVEFTAIPDLTIDNKMEPVFDYTVYADVTDINGETRSEEKMVSVSYKALLLKTTIPAALPLDSLKSLSIRTENMNGEFEPSTLTVSITKLVAEKRLIRDRYWERPDQFIMSKEEYIRYFPYDEYNNESDFKSWQKGEKVLERSDSARVNGQLAIGNRQFASGYYVVEITARNKNGDEVKDIQYIELYDEKAKQLNRPDYLWANGKRTTVEPGETATVEVGTAADNLFVIQQIEKTSSRRTQEPGSFTYTSLNDEKRNFSFPATEADRGGYGVSWAFVKHNRFYQYNQTISVPWTNKDLAIEYISYRDKTLPGSEEKWKIKITGNKKEKVAAEVLASMYDASLDQFYEHQWNKPGIWPVYARGGSWTGTMAFGQLVSDDRHVAQLSKSLDKKYDNLFYDYEYVGSYMGDMMYLKTADMASPPPEAMQAPMLMRLPKPVYKTEAEAIQAKANGVILPDEDGDGITDQFDANKTAPQGGEVQVRKNFNETAFFFPDLKTDSEGNIEFSFTLPEAMTKWKFQALAVTRDLAIGYSSKEIVTQKEVMVQPNAPRFVREGDKMEFSSKIVNLTDKEITGQVYLELYDAATNQSVDGWFKSSFPNQFFTVGAKQSEVVKFPIEIPYLFDKALVWRIVAKAGVYSDGEENALPVLTNRMLVTETMPLNMRGTGTKNFTFEKLLKSGNSESLQHQSLTIEYTSNPAWYAVQALPYLMEYPYDCAEQTWNRYYANSLASMIANSSPRIKQIFEQWKTKDTAALLSNLQKNQELKSILLEETPWVLQAKTEAEQKKNIALLFDMVKMSQQLNNSLEKLKQSQLDNGGFVWFQGGPDDRYITQYIVTGIGHLKKLNALAKGQENKVYQILATAIPYLDKKIKEDYDKLTRNKTDLKKYTPGHEIIQYLYMRSFFPEYGIEKGSVTAYNYFRERARLTWTSQSKYMQGMTALALYRTKDNVTPAAILKSLKETSISNEELGMYWKDLATGGWFWHQAPIETQSLLIEVITEIGKDTKTADDLRTWLLKNKQTNNWRTTKATAEACYALLLQGSNWLSNEPSVEIKLGPARISSAGEAEAGTGYFKKVIEGQKVIPQMGNISVTIGASHIPPSGGGGVTWGSAYWQYFEDLDKITTATTPLKLDKKLFVEKNSDRGPVLTSVKDGDYLKVGDKIKVRVELRVDRDMEYVHMKDMRASALEPVNVLSGYKWQGGLGYYESTKDASTNFFFSYLRKGVYVFEYSLFVTHTGNFSNGVTTIQCMYAPEFTSHSEGIRINVE